MSGPVPQPVTYPVTYTHYGDLSIVAGSNTALTGIGKLTVTGGIIQASSTVTGTSTIALGTTMVIVNSAGAATITIPSAVTAGNGYKVTVVSVGGGAATVGAVAGNINGAATHALGAAYNAATYLSNGANYFIISAA
jgi:hypothetical protein